jgi:hypothetical protein
VLAGALFGALAGAGDETGADGVGVADADGGGGGGALGRKALPTALALCTGTSRPVTLPLLRKVKFTYTESPCSSGATSPRRRKVMCGSVSNRPAGVANSLAMGLPALTGSVRG